MCWIIYKLTEITKYHPVRRIKPGLVYKIVILNFCDSWPATQMCADLGNEQSDLK